MNRTEKILREYVAFVEMSEETQREIVRRLEDAYIVAHIIATSEEKR